MEEGSIEGGGAPIAKSDFRFVFYAPKNPIQANLNKIREYLLRLFIFLLGRWHLRRGRGTQSKIWLQIRVLRTKKPHAQKTDDENLNFGQLNFWFIPLWATPSKLKISLSVFCQQKVCFSVFRKTTKVTDAAAHQQLWNTRIHEWARR